MPQIWMTYLELAGLVDCSPEQARALAIDRHLKRKHSHDGQTRIQLNAELSWLFVAKVREIQFDTDEAVAGLRQVHRQMAGGTLGDAIESSHGGARAAGR